MRCNKAIYQYELIRGPRTLIARVRGAVVPRLRKLIAQVLTWRCGLSRVVEMFSKLKLVSFDIQKRRALLISITMNIVS